MVRENKVEAMPIYYYLTFMCCQPCLPNFQCFQSCASWTPFCISSCCVSHAIVSGVYPSVVVSWAWSKCLSRLAEYDDVIRGAPIFSLASGPPNLKPTPVYMPYRAYSSKVLHYVLAKKSLSSFVLFLRQLYLTNALNFVREFSTIVYCFFYSIFYSLLHQVLVTLTTVATILKNSKYCTLQWSM